LNIANSKILQFSAIIIFFVLVSILPFPWNDSVNDSLIELQFKLRGERQITDDFVVIYIGDEDLKTLGSWPISRDYYSYIIHILTSSGARVIALDVLLAQKNKYHPEYDRTLVDFVKNAGNVCLPLTFSEIITTDSSYKGINATYPFKELLESATCVGFSNFSKLENVRNVPLIAEHKNDIHLSFGYQMAALFSKENLNNSNSNAKRIRLNHFGSLENITSIGFVDLLQTHKNNPDSLNFKGKLVLVTVTATGVANLKSTPFDNAFPSSLVHLTVAENLINFNYLVDTPLYLNLIIMILLGAGYWILVTIFKRKSIVTPIIYLCVYWIAAMLFFSFSNLTLPLFYPSLAIISLMIAQQIVSTKELQKMDSVIHVMLQTELEGKENQLLSIKEKLKESDDQLKNESELKEEIQLKATENKNQVLQLEKEINDLKLYSNSGTFESKEILEFEKIIYSKDSKMTEILDLVSKVVTSDIPVLIYGETGTGKEMIANAIHKKSERKNAPFVALNCGALPETLLESELFGHEKGSFTGATSMRKGKFELADGGIIFLDEISETSPAFQAKLLRVLQESTFARVGGEKSIKVDVRVIAATNKDLQKEIDENRFRSDLFFRLNGFPIAIPSLIERTEDIPLLTQHFLEKHDFKVSFSNTAMKTLLNYCWPGNVRELENIVRRAAIMASSSTRELIQKEDLPDEIQLYQKTQNLESIHKPLEDQILESLRSLKFSRSAISQTAKALGNKDRGTITEYFRGICFQKLIESNFNILQTAQLIADTSDDNIVKQVEIKINEYVNNLKSNIKSSESSNIETLSKGLPKKYHEYLREVITYLSNKPT